MYEFTYQNKEEYKILEKVLKNLNELTYKKLKEVYLDLKTGDLSYANLLDFKKDIYEIALPTDLKLKKLYGSIKLIFEIVDNNINLLSLLPQDLLLASYNNELTIYKDVIIPVKNANLYEFKIDLINMLSDK